MPTQVLVLVAQIGEVREVYMYELAQVLSYEWLEHYRYQCIDLKSEGAF